MVFDYVLLLVLLCLGFSRGADIPGQRSRPILVIADFDGTLTKEDTTQIILDEGLNSPLRSANERAILKRKLDAAVTLYFKELADYEAKFKFKASPVAPSYRDVQLRKFLEEHDDIGLKSIYRLHELGVLAKITPAGLNRAGAKAKELIRPEVAKLTSLFGEIPVITLSWSKDMVEYALADPRFRFYGSNLKKNKNKITTGKIQTHVQSASAKEELMQKMRSERDCFMIFLGDSLGDILALLNADIGFVIGKSGSFRRVAASHGIEIKALTSLQETNFRALASLAEEAKEANRRLLFSIDSLEQVIQLQKSA